jgi:hypothetical protein
LPIMLVLPLVIVEGPRSIKVIRLGQNPLPGEKVLQPTKYTYGTKAKLKPVLFFVVVVFLFGLSIRGVYWANDIIGKASDIEQESCISS